MPDANRQVYDNYVAELKKENRSVANIRFASGFQWLLVSKDPEKTFSEAADHVIHQANHYTEWLSKGGHLPNPVHLGVDRRHEVHLIRLRGRVRVPGSRYAFMFVPVTQLAYWYLPKNKNNKGSSLVNLCRNWGGSFGIAFATTMLERQTQYQGTEATAWYKAVLELNRRLVVAQVEATRSQIKIHAGNCVGDLRASSRDFLSRAVEYHSGRGSRVYSSGI